MLDYNWSQKISDGRKLFFLDVENISNMTTWNDMTPAECFFVGYFITSWMIARTFCSFACYFPFLAVIMVWACARNFSREISTSMAKSDGNVNTIQWPEMFRKYENLRDLCDLANGTFGIIVALNMGQCVLSKAIYLDIVFRVHKIGHIVEALL